MNEHNNKGYGGGEARTSDCTIWMRLLPWKDDPSDDNHHGMAKNDESTHDFSSW